jgi:hypothetical protein
MSSLGASHEKLRRTDAMYAARTESKLISIVLRFIMIQVHLPRELHIQRIRAGAELSARLFTHNGGDLAPSG